jgi:hypothetical protein
MLQVHRDLNKSLVLRIRKAVEEDEIYEGMMFLSKFTRELQKEMDQININNSQFREDIKATYLKTVTSYSATLDPLFRFLNHFLIYIDESGISPTLKKKYIDIIKSQMSGIEQYSFFYHTVAQNAPKKVALLEKYLFFENIDSASLAFDKQKEIFFPKTKFEYYTNEVPLSYH